MRCCQRGFTLLEVLVAFTLLTVLFGALFEVFASGLTVTRSGEVRSHAVLLAKSKLAEIGADNGVGPGTHYGVFDVNTIEGARYRWRAEIHSYGEDALGRADGGELLPYSVTVEVFWDMDGREERLELSSLVLRPK